MSVDNNLIQEDNSKIDNSSKQQKQKDNKKVLLQLRKINNNQQDIKKADEHKSDENKSDDDSILKNNPQDDALIKNEINHNRETSDNSKIVTNDKSSSQRKLRIKDDSRIKIEKNKDLSYSENKIEQLSLLKNKPSSHNKNEELINTATFSQQNQTNQGNLSQSSSQVNNPSSKFYKKDSDF